MLNCIESPLRPALPCACSRADATARSTLASRIDWRVSVALPEPETATPANRLPGPSAISVLACSAGCSVPCALTLPSSLAEGIATKRDGSTSCIVACRLKSPASLRSSRAEPASEPPPVCARKRVTSMRGAVISAANASDRSRSRSVPSTVCFVASAVASTLPARRVVASRVSIRARSTSRRASFSCAVSGRAGVAAPAAAFVEAPAAAFAEAPAASAAPPGVIRALPAALPPPASVAARSSRASVVPSKL